MWANPLHLHDLVLGISQTNYRQSVTMEENKIFSSLFETTPNFQR